MDIINFAPEDVSLWLRYVLNPDKETMPQVKNWQAVYDFADKQQITGICSPTPYPVRLDEDLLFLWIDDEQQIRQQNVLLNKRIRELCEVLEKAGLRFCILKGQGNAELYPVPGLRCAGDIDVWIDGDENVVLDFVKKRFPDIEQTFKHIKFPVFDDVEVDVHVTPLKLYHPKYNKALQKWIEHQKAEQFAHKIELSNSNVMVNVPTARFNVVYQMGHILIHLLDEGIGMRHLVDYYYVLRTLGVLSETDRKQITKEWNRFGMLRLATAVMWVEKDVLGLSDELLIIEPNARRGKLLLAEILEGGNFGHYGSIQSLKDSYFIFRFSKVKRLLKISSLFPREAACRLLYKVKMYVQHLVRRK